MLLSSCLTLGIMGIISSNGAGASPIYADSCFLLDAGYWRLRAIFGGYNLPVLLLVGAPILLFLI
jgi:L-tartrate/succinate antiporter